MALELKQTTQYNVGVVVRNAVTAVRAIRSQENSRKEAEFQKAAAAGMTYEEQLAFRQEQLEEEKAGGFIDEDYIAGLEKTVAQTKQLVRFEKIRTKYKDALDNYVTGKESINSYLDLLNETLDGEKDETMRTEIRNLISSAQKEKSDNELNAIKNRALVAQKDNSVKLVDASIKEIKSKRARASIAENDDEVAMWDETLIALEGSKSKLNIEDSMNEITFKINKYNPKANDKLGYLNDEISKADDTGEIVYGGVTYPSLKAYWENKRNEYIASGYFDEVKKDMDAETARIAATSAYGQIPTARIQAVNDFFNNIKARPEFAPYADQIEQKKVESVSAMSNDLAESIFNEAATTGDQTKAQNAILGIESKFGVKVSREPFQTELNKGSSIATEVLKTPSVVAPGAPGVGGEKFVTVENGSNLSKVAAANGISLLQLLDANPEYKVNPGMVKAGASIKIPGGTAPVTPPVAPAPIASATVTPPASTPAPAAPATEPVRPPTSTPASKPVAPVTPPVVKPVVTPVAPVAPVAPTKYTGNSIVDLLKSKGMDSSYEARKRLAAESGITNYTGDLKQNEALLKKYNT